MNIRRRHKSDVETFLTSLFNGEEEDSGGKVLVPNIRVSYFPFFSKEHVQQLSFQDCSTIMHRHKLPKKICQVFLAKIRNCIRLLYYTTNVLEYLTENC